MSSTQVRIGESTHRTIRSLAKDRGESLQSVVEQAVERFRREMFLEGLKDDFAALRENTEEWNSELEERELWDNTLGDGDDD